MGGKGSGRKKGKKKSSKPYSKKYLQSHQKGPVTKYQVKSHKALGKQLKKNRKR